MKRPVMIKYLLKDPDIGALAATSIFGVQHVCSKINPDDAKVIVEYGPGTGVFTNYILKNFNHIEKFILIEKNKDFYNLLKKTIVDKRVCIFNDSAENILDILHHHYRETKVNYIISGIPFSYFDESVRLRILINTREALVESGKFLIYQYRRLIYKYLSELFSHVTYEREIRNFPPLFICEAIK